MSKAFTKEGDGDAEEALPSYTPPWPPGARNYVTAAGYARLREEREALLQRTASALGREERRRLQILTVHVEAAEVVAPPAPPVERVQFGVTVRVSGERERSYTIVGVDEVDVAQGRISWLSPIAQALSGRRVGDEITVHTPRGEEELTIVALESPRSSSSPE